MNAMEAVTRMVAALEKLQVGYMAVGSFSVNMYAVPRSTKDADFVIELGGTPISAILGELGEGFVLDNQMSFETITATTRYRLHHRDTKFLIELFLLSDDPHDRERYSRRVHGLVGQHKTYVPTAEDVLIQKLRWSRHGRRQKDIEDCRAILTAQLGRIDLGYIRKWCDSHGTRDIFEELLAEAETRAKESS